MARPRRGLDKQVNRHDEYAAGPVSAASLVLQLAPHREGVTFVTTSGLRTVRNTAGTVTETQAWSTFTASPRHRSGIQAGEGRLDDYMGSPHREVAAIGLRILMSFAIVLTLAGGFTYLPIRAVAP